VSKIYKIVCGLMDDTGCSAEFEESVEWWSAEGYQLQGGVSAVPHTVEHESGKTFSQTYTLFQAMAKDEE